VARAPGDDFRVDRLGGIRRFAQPVLAPRSDARRLSSVAATTGARMDDTISEGTAVRGQGLHALESVARC
jgi:hypothetical protein